MLGLVQKIILTVITFFVIISFGAGLYTILKSTNYNFNFRQLITAITFLIAVCSFIFHIKTISLYKKRKNFNEVVDKWLWILNLIFGVLMVVYGLLMIYKVSDFYDKQFQTEYLYLILITVLVFMFGIWILIDLRFLYNKTQKAKAQSVIDSIDDITGNNDIK